MSFPRVSVVMPVRNVAATIEPAVESILSQTWTDFEFVIVDHDSTDDTAKLLSQFAREDSRLTVHTARGTFVEAANLAWRESRGDWIARMDGDDVASPNRLERQLAFLEWHPSLCGCGSLVSIVRRHPVKGTVPAEDGYRRYEQWVNSVIDPEQVFVQRFVDSPIPNPTAMLHRSVLEKLGGYHDPSWAEDYDFWLRLLEAGYQLGKVPEVLLDWYDDPGRSTRTMKRYELSKFQEAKAHFLVRLSSVRDLGVVLCGAGPIGKEMLRFLRSRGVEIHAFLEVNERQIGNRIDGVPILRAEQLGEFASRAVALGAVGQPGARDRIRSLALPAGFIEGQDFFCVA